MLVAKEFTSLTTHKVPVHETDVGYVPGPNPKVLAVQFTPSVLDLIDTSGFQLSLAPPITHLEPFQPAQLAPPTNTLEIFVHVSPLSELLNVALVETAIQYVSFATKLPLEMAGALKLVHVIPSGLVAAFPLLPLPNAIHMDPFHAILCPRPPIKGLFVEGVHVTPSELFIAVIVLLAFCPIATQ